MEFSSPERMVVGSELEYGFSYTPGPADQKGNYFRLQQALWKPTAFHPPGLKSIEDFLSNGGRLYEDHSHPEYSTPECTNLDDLLAHEYAGEEIVTRMLMAQVLRGAIKNFSLHRRVLGTDGNSWGYHLNHQVKRKAVITPNNSFDQTKLALLGLHNATNIIYTGSGVVHDNRFYIAQKARHIWSDFNTSTTSSKPVVNLRDDPLASGNDYARIHITCGDPHPSPWALKTHAGTNRAVLKLIEHGVTLDSMGIRLHPSMPLHQIMRFVSRDVSLKQAFPLAQSEVRAIDVQYRILKYIKQLPDSERTPEIRDTEQRLESVLDDLDSDPSKTTRRVVWTKKYETIHDALRKDSEAEVHVEDGVPFYQNAYTDEKAFKIDTRFDLCVTAGRRRSDRKLYQTEGVGRKLRILGWWEDSQPKEVVEKAVTTAPADTRAYIRGGHIANYGPEVKMARFIQWAYYRDEKNKLHSYGPANAADRNYLPKAEAS